MSETEPEEAGGPHSETSQSSLGKSLRGFGASIKGMLSRAASRQLVEQPTGQVGIAALGYGSCGLDRCMCAT